MDDDNVTPLHPVPDGDLHSPLTDPKHEASMAAMDQWLTRLDNRLRRVYRLVEMGAPRIIVENELGLVNTAALHLTANVVTAMEPVRLYIEESMSKEVDLLDLTGLDDEPDDDD